MGLNSSTTTSGFQGYGNNITFSHTVGSGDDRMLIVGVAGQRGFVSGVTYGGVSMTLAHSGPYTPAAGTPVSWYIYYLVAPTVGTANVAVTLSSSDSQGTAFAVSGDGMAQSSVVDKTGQYEAEYPGSPVTVSLSSAPAGTSNVVGMFAHNHDGAITATSGQTDFAVTQGLGSNAVAAGLAVGASSMSWSFSPGDPTAGAAAIVAFNATAAAPTIGTQPTAGPTQSILTKGLVS